MIPVRVTVVPGVGNVSRTPDQCPFWCRHARAASLPDLARSSAVMALTALPWPAILMSAARSITCWQAMASLLLNPSTVPYHVPDLSGKVGVGGEAGGMPPSSSGLLPRHSRHAADTTAIR